MAKIFVTRPIPQNGIEMLKAKGYEVVVNTAAADRPATEAEMIAGIKGADALMPLLTDKVTKAVIEAGLPTLKIIGSYSSGFNHIDLDTAKANNIFVTNTPDVLTEAVAEHTVSLILAITRRIPESDRHIRANKWNDAWASDFMIGMELAGKVLGIVGPGRIGSRVAEIANAFKMKVSTCGPGDSIDDFLPQCDVVSLHVPLLDSTHHMINEARLKKMKTSAFLINTSRGPIIDEAILATALREKWIAGAALDVFENEPNVNPELLKLENLVMTPHIASATQEARVAMAEMAATNIIEALEGRTPPNLVK